MEKENYIKKKGGKEEKECNSIIITSNSLETTALKLKILNMKPMFEENVDQIYPYYFLLLRSTKWKSSSVD